MLRKYLLKRRKVLITKDLGLGGDAAFALSAYRATSYNTSIGKYHTTLCPKIYFFWHETIFGNSWIILWTIQDCAV